MDLQKSLDSIDLEFDLLSAYVREGGSGSGNFGHAGVPGQQGGSASQIGTTGTFIGQGTPIYDTSVATGRDVSGGYSVASIKQTGSGYSMKFSGPEGEVEFTKIKPIQRGAATRFEAHGPKGDRSWSVRAGPEVDQPISKYFKKEYGMDYSKFPNPVQGASPEGKPIFGVTLPKD